jgi:ADP-ribosyl-[dinitrogen reductase] hydrolase
MTQDAALKGLSASDNAAYGAVFGALVGDAAGATLEFIGRSPTKKEVREALKMIGGGVWQIAPGQITDDGELTLASLHALSKQPEYSADLVASAYIAWANSKPFDMGMATANALSGVTPKSGEGCSEAVLEAAAYYNMGSKANGALMRSTALAVWSTRVTVEEAIKLAQLDARLTHPNLSCQYANAAYIVAIRHLVLQPGDRTGALKTAAETLQVLGAEEVRAWFDHALVDGEVSCHPTAGFIKIAFTLAFKHLAKSTAYETALSETLMGGGDTDTNACIVGGLLGTLHGVNGIPVAMTQALLSCDTKLGRKRPPLYSTRDLVKDMKRLREL